MICNYHYGNSNCSCNVIIVETRRDAKRQLNLDKTLLVLIGCVLNRILRYVWKVKVAFFRLFFILFFCCFFRFRLVSFLFCIPVDFYYIPTITLFVDTLFPLTFVREFILADGVHVVVSDVAIVTRL